MPSIRPTTWVWGALLALALAAWGCTPRAAEGAPEAPRQLAEPSLARRYEALFPIGAAVDPTARQTHAALLEQHFNSVTAENEMKFESLERTEGTFDYAEADALVAYARAHGMRVRGHTLVWHRQTPDWVFQDASGAPASRDVLLARLKNHIDNVVTHFKGSVYAWDVVNEAVTDDGKYRTNDEAEADQRSRWHAILGVDYIAGPSSTPTRPIPRRSSSTTTIATTSPRSGRPSTRCSKSCWRAACRSTASGCSVT